MTPSRSTRVYQSERAESHSRERGSEIARFVRRALIDARDNGLTDTDLEQRTGIKASTFYRWQSGDAVPQPASLARFCRGLGLSLAEALGDLAGAQENADIGRPRPAARLAPELVSLSRKLADPQYPAHLKRKLRQVLRDLDALTDQPEERPSRRRGVA